MNTLLLLVLAAFVASVHGEDSKGKTMATFISSWGRQGEAPGEFDIPIGIAINGRDEVFVTDHYNNRVQRFDAEGKLLSHFPVKPNPGGIAAHDGQLFITHFPGSSKTKETVPDRVTVYSEDGQFVREWGSTGTGDGQFHFAGGVAATPTGEIYVADQTNRRVQVFDREGHFLRKWGEYGTEAGQFGGNTSAKSRVGGPNFIAVDASSDVLTTEASMGRVQKFSRDGKALLAWGSLDDKPGALGGFFTGFKTKLIGPIGICIDSQQRLWVSAASGRVQCFLPDGTYVGGIGETQGTEEGRFFAPHGLAVNSRNELFVVDSYNHRVQKFRIRRE